MIDVCCAIILKESKILAVQRGPGSSHPWLWEFPGGKIHPDESVEHCIIREIEEELKVGIEVLSSLSSVDFDYGSKQIRLFPFVCRILSGEIFLTEHMAKYWFNFDEWQTIDWSGADRKLILQNQESIRLLLQKK
ncbi:MAG TPA: (deoxy)nucleoside triphosphate pyrophosphohydrolase [Prolixibacteraceae bacterium]